MAEAVFEGQVVALTSDACEYLCGSCAHFRLWPGPGKPTVCGSCGAADIECGPLDGLALMMKRDKLVRQRVEQVANAGAEDGDPDIEQLAVRAFDGDRHAQRELLVVWSEWKAEGHFAEAKPGAAPGIDEDACQYGYPSWRGQ